MDEQQMTNKLMEVFSKFKRIHTRKSPIPGLTPGEVMLLIHISRLKKLAEKGMKVSDLSNHMKVAPPSITQLINTLEAAGYVERSMDRSDRRAVRVNLTQKGEEVVARATGIYMQTIKGLVEYIGEEKCNKLIEIMGEVYNYFEKIATSDTCGDNDGR